MVLVPLILLLAAAPDSGQPSGQTRTAVIAVRAQVVQTCIVSTATAAARCRGALDRPARSRVVRDGRRVIVTF